MLTRDADTLLTYRQLAERLQVSPGTLRNWVSQQFIPRVKLGRPAQFSLHRIAYGQLGRPLGALPG